MNPSTPLDIQAQVKKILTSLKDTTYAEDVILLRHYTPTLPLSEANKTILGKSACNAIIKNDLETLNFFFNRKVFEPSTVFTFTTNERVSMLVFAIEKKKWDVVEMLLERGADFDLYEDSKALPYCAEKKELIDRLIKLGSKGDKSKRVLDDQVALKIEYYAGWRSAMSVEQRLAYVDGVLSTSIVSNKDLESLLKRLISNSPDSIASIIGTPIEAAILDRITSMPVLVAHAMSSLERDDRTKDIPDHVYSHGSVRKGLQQKSILWTESVDDLKKRFDAQNPLSSRAEVIQCLKFLAEHAAMNSQPNDLDTRSKYNALVDSVLAKYQPGFFERIFYFKSTLYSDICSQLNLLQEESQWQQDDKKAGIDDVFIPGVQAISAKINALSEGVGLLKTVIEGLRSLIAVKPFNPGKVIEKQEDMDIVSMQELLSSQKTKDNGLRTVSTLTFSQSNPKSASNADNNPFAIDSFDVADSNKRKNDGSAVSLHNRL